MSRVVKMNIIEQKMLSNSEAAEILRGVVENIKSREGNVSPLLAKTLNYLEKHSKVKGGESVQSARMFLKGLGFKDETIVMILNICPKTIEELRILLDYEERYVEENVLKETLEYLKNVCS